MMHKKHLDYRMTYGKSSLLDIIIPFYSWSYTVLFVSYILSKLKEKMLSS